MKQLSRFLLRFGLGACLCASVLLKPSGALAAEPPPPDAQPPAAPGAGSSHLSANAGEVLRMAESGVGEQVVLAYVENNQAPFELSAADIIYLKDLGVSAPIIAAMVRRDTVLRQQGVQSPAVPADTNRFVYDQKLYAPPNYAPITPATPGPGAPAPAAPDQPAPAPAPPPEAATAPLVPPPVYVSSPPPQVSYFYDSLNPYGAWIELEGVGWCWQPRVVAVDHSWRPYWHGGRWVYSDLGWDWLSDYSWGWAPFHYGRWQQHARCGWVWSPDLVWAPAWVCWRTSESYCGWAPLPVGALFVIGQGWRFNGVSVGINFDFGLRANLFGFVELRHFHEGPPHLYSVPPARVTTIYNQTTIINNYVVNNNTIINKGIPVERVAAASGTKIQPVKIKESSAAAQKGRQPERIQQVGATPVIYRPPLKAPPKVGPVVAQKIDERHPVPVFKPVPVRPMASVPATVGATPARVGATPVPVRPAPVKHEQPAERKLVPAQPASRPIPREQSVERIPPPSQPTARVVPREQPLERAVVPAQPAPRTVPREQRVERKFVPAQPAPRASAPSEPANFPRVTALPPQNPRAESPRGRELRESIPKPAPAPALLPIPGRAPAYQPPPGPSPAHRAAQTPESGQHQPHKPDGSARP
jgi:hypothetical protein